MDVNVFEFCVVRLFEEIHTGFDSPMVEDVVAVFDLIVDEEVELEGFGCWAFFTDNKDRGVFDTETLEPLFAVEFCSEMGTVGDEIKIVTGLL